MLRPSAQYSCSLPSTKCSSNAHHCLVVNNHKSLLKISAVVYWTTKISVHSLPELPKRLAIIMYEKAMISNYNFKRQYNFLKVFFLTSH
jgi:hypothetical protein